MHSLRIKFSYTHSYRFGKTLRFPCARDKPPREQKTLVAGSYRLRFPTGVFVFFLR